MKLGKLNGIFALLLIAALTLTACGGTTSSTAPAAPSGSGSPAEASPSGGNAPDATSSADPFVLGFFCPLSGPSAEAGQQDLNAVQLAVEQINARGGLNGAQITVVSYDDEADPATALAAATKLCTTDGANAIVGSIMSSCMVGVLDTITQYKVPTFTGGTSPTLTNKGCEYIFRSTINQDYCMADVMTAYEMLGVKKAALVTGQDEAQIASGDQFVASCEALGIEIVGWEKVSDTDTDYTAQCARIVNAAPDTVFFAAAATPQPLIVKQLRANGYKGLLWHKESLQMNAIEIAGEASDYVCFSWPTVSYTDSEDATGRMKAFLEDYYAAYGAYPTSDCAYRGYDAMLVLEEAAKIAGSNESEAIAKAIATIKDFECLGGMVDYTNGTGEGYASGNLYYIKDGAYHSFSAWYESGGYDEFIASVS